MIIRYLCVKCDTPTNNEDTLDKGRAASASFEPARVEKAQSDYY